MPFDFESEQVEQAFEDFEKNPEQENTSPIDEVANMMISNSSNSIESEAERIFEIGKYYKLFLSQPIFDSDDEIAIRVEEEFKAFARERLAVVLGIKKEKESEKELFTPDELASLKALAALGEDAAIVVSMLLSKVSGKIVQPKKEEPKLQPVVVSASPTPKPEPTMKTVVTPKPKPQPARRQEQQVQKAQPQQRGRTQQKQNSVKIPAGYENDPTLKIEGNRIFVQNRTADGQLMFAVAEDGAKRPMMKEITPKAKPTGVQPMPMPTEAQMAGIASNVIAESKKLNKGDNQILTQMGVTI